MSYPLNRRRLLQSATAATLGHSLLGPPAATGQRVTPQHGSAREHTVQENAKQGTTDWQLTRVWVNRGGYRTSLIEGYASHQSITAGQTLHLMVSTDPPVDYMIDVYRMGYYQGTGARHMTRLGPLAGRVQPVPEMGPQRLRECRWEAAAELTIPDDWPSGVYLAKLTTVPRGVTAEPTPGQDVPYWQSYIIFIVRDRRPADILFQCSDNTWQAYNLWPENESLYTHPDGAHAPGVAVSFDRPYGKYCQILDHPLSVGSGEFLLWEFPLCYWLEQNGYDVTYCSNSDVTSADDVTRCATLLSVGHDEYWDMRQYHAVREAIERGTNVLWLGGNCVYMVSPFAPSSPGRPDRIISRLGSFGPLRAEEVEAYGSFMGPFAFHGPDERTIIGARTIVPFNGGGDWVCTRPDHWIFEGTGMQRGDVVPGLVGWEFHGDPDLDRHGLEVVAEGTAWTGGRQPAHWTATIYPGPEGNFVFNASTIFWAQALASPPGHILPWSHHSRPHGPDPRVQRITANLLDRRRA